VVDNRFDWEGDCQPETPLADSVIYEVHVKGFFGAESKSSGKTCAEPTRDWHMNPASHYSRNSA